ncbi:hypothetical protein D3C71_791860 [compost metagenome]
MDVEYIQSLNPFAFMRWIPCPFAARMLLITPPVLIFKACPGRRIRCHEQEGANATWTTCSNVGAVLPYEGMRDHPCLIDRISIIPLFVKGEWDSVIPDLKGLATRILQVNLPTKRTVRLSRVGLHYFEVPNSTLVL